MKLPRKRYELFMVKYFLLLCDSKKLNQMYDETGRLLENSLDICDCLDKDCPGCHFPCPKCASEKCGAECRSGRRWTYEQVEVEGTNLVFKWSSTTAS